MRKMTIVLVALAIVSFIAIPTAHAKGFPPNYIALKVGGFFPQSSDLNDINADAGGSVEIAFGQSIVPGFAVEGALGYFETNGGTATSLGRADEKFEVIPLTINLRGQVPYGRFEPYGFIGTGVYFIKDNLSNPTLGSTSENDTALGFQVGLGGNYTLLNNMFLGVEARYLFLKTNTFGESFRLDGINLTCNIGYRF
jgi:opacity protein-like surface antigen